MNMVKDILEMFTGVMITLIILIMMGLVGYSATHYNRTGVIISVKNNNVLIEDTTGNLWGIDDDSYTEGQVVLMKMHTKGTDNIIADDEVVDVKIVNTNSNNND